MNKLLAVFAISLFLAAYNLANASSKELEADQKSGELYAQAQAFLDERADLRVKLDKATDNLIRTAVGELRKRGHGALAGSIEMDWNSRYHGFILQYGTGRGIGDHEAVAWLLKIHDDIEFVIGKTICKALRIHDLWTIAYTIPVVFKCVDNVDFAEYAKHFIPLCGIASYWVSYGVCVGATMGSGVVMFCGLIGMGVEELVVRFIAPPLSPKAWKKACSH